MKFSMLAIAGAALSTGVYGFAGHAVPTSRSFASRNVSGSWIVIHGAGKKEYGSVMEHLEIGPNRTVWCIHPD